MKLKEFLIATVLAAAFGGLFGRFVLPTVIDKEIRRQDIACLNYMHQGYPVKCINEVK